MGAKEHFEVVAHTAINAFFISSDFRQDVELYIVLDSSEDFPRTIKLSSNEGLSLTGFHEEAIVSLVEQALKNSQGLQKNKTCTTAPGVAVLGFGLDTLINQLIETRPLYVLDKKGANYKTITLKPNPVFILSDHLVMPKKTLKSLKRRGLEAISLGKTMLFASQCVVLLHHEMDGQ
jgi:tRNA (pseudouridine54-N1)-methyltransferase